MAVTTDAVDGTEERELDYRALTEYLTVLEDGDERAARADGLYTVTSHSGKTYLVDPELPACECADNEYRDRRCKHIRRVRFALGWRPIPYYVDENDVDPQLGIHVRDVDGIDRGEGVATDGGEDIETRRNISESADKIRVETTVKRGEGTRDEDRIKVKVKGDKATEVVEKLNNTIELLEYTADDLRRIQPGDEGDEDR